MQMEIDRCLEIDNSQADAPDWPVASG